MTTLIDQLQTCSDIWGIEGRVSFDKKTQSVKASGGSGCGSCSQKERVSEKFQHWLQKVIETGSWQEEKGEVLSHAAQKAWRSLYTQQGNSWTPRTSKVAHCLLALAPQISKDKVSPKMCRELEGIALQTQRLLWSTFENCAPKDLADDYIHLGVSEKEKAALAEFARYPSLLEQLKNDKSLGLFALKWVLVDHAPPELFVKFPDLAEQMYRSKLSRRMGLVGEWSDFVDSSGVIPKIKVAGEFVEYHGLDSQVHFAKGSYSWKELFRIFDQRGCHSPVLVQPKVGITEWNKRTLEGYSHVTGSYHSSKENDILEGDKWYHKLPKFIQEDTFSLQDLKEKLGEIKGEEDPEAIVSLVLECPKNRYQGHGKINIYYKIDDGMYRYLSFGKMGAYDTETGNAGALEFVDFVPGHVHYPDETIFWRYQEESFWNVAIGESSLKLLMNDIRKDIQESREGKLLFQQSGYNCGSWAAQRFDTVAEDILGERMFDKGFTKFTKAIGKLYPSLSKIDKGARRFFVDAFVKLLRKFQGSAVMVKVADRPGEEPRVRKLKALDAYMPYLWSGKGF